MTDWLSEIEDKNKKLGESTGSDSMGEITRIARVLRELVGYIASSYEELGAIEPTYNNLSEDAKEIFVAAGESSDERN